ncbi:MAG: glycosyltransferase family 2 protein [Candidatus Cloacimonetes bacterium]|nr:glycosyltransferase family 2 protein [Candidatus Cloacimonadota bacterium]
MYKTNKIGFVVNYYWRPTFSEYVRESARFAISMIESSSIVDRILLIDGSPIPDIEMQEVYRSKKVQYLHLGKELGFAEALNEGWKRLDTEFIGLMASDVYPTPETLKLLVDVLTLPNVGLVFPYLDFCDYPGQVSSFVRNPVSCEPSSMSLNLNLIKKKVLEEIGGIDENYSGGYNDLILLMKIRKIGQKVILVGNTRTSHLGRATVSQGTNFNMAIDNPRFSTEYPEYRTLYGPWNITHWKYPFATTKRAKVFWWIAQNFPLRKIRNFLIWFAMWLEPDLTRFRQ